MSNPSLSEDLRRILLHSTRVSSFFLGRDDNYHERLAPGYVLSTMEIHTPNSSWENPWKIHGTSAWWFQTCVFSTALWDDILTWFNPPPQVKKSEKWLLLVHKPSINPVEGCWIMWYVYPSLNYEIMTNPTWLGVYRWISSNRRCQREIPHTLFLYMGIETHWNWKVIKKKGIYMNIMNLPGYQNTMFAYLWD